MNKEILADQLFQIWIALPHCRIHRRKYMEKVRSSIDFENNGNISLITANCIGGELYSILGIQFLSPFINVSIDRKEFLTLCEHLKLFMDSEIDVTMRSNGSCMGRLATPEWGEVRIKFPHDNDPQKVADNWNRRKKRINWDKLVLICDDKGLTEEDILRFEQIPAYKKVLFTEREYPDIKCAYKLKSKSGGGIGDYNGKSLGGLWKFTSMWDVAAFFSDR